jgi:formylglycine-generating enzyme required for sulfatase activity
MTEAGSGEKLKVFVSYSRRDSSDFAEELVAGLEVAGFTAFLDRHDIVAGEDWEARLGGLIEQADTVVFVVSPEAVKSERCVWEVDKALAEAKRLLPVVWKAVPDSEIPAQLSRRQFVRFDTGVGFARPLGQLAEALRQDIDWLREHTRLGELARRWDARGRPESLLLRGDDISAAQAWSERRAPGAPNVTDLMQAFFAASKATEAALLAKSNAAQRRMIRMQWLVCALLVGVIIILVGVLNEGYLKEQWRWFTAIRPYMVAQVRPHVLAAEAERALKPGDAFKECAKDCPEMVVVPAGAFIMGSPASEQGRDLDEQQHKVVFAAPFAVAKFEVTFDDWDACVAYGDCDRVSDSAFGRGRQPVINVTWYDARRYAAWLARMTGKPYRLLSEAEFEYAARAGTQTAYPWGDEIGKGNANCGACGSRWDGKQPSPVGSFAANRFGLYDMHGNVWQWVEDCYHADYEGAPQDGSAWIEGADCTGRIVRGGSWSNDPRVLRSATRGRITSGDRSGYLVGFRVARTLLQP